ncbi:hypothetical protein PHOSAC3_150041 [Mesotoga infera]|nr:hypothetical protein PHOSAC3_150041 [Mesotoga infera]
MQGIPHSVQIAGPFSQSKAQSGTNPEVLDTEVTIADKVPLNWLLMVERVIRSTSLRSSKILSVASYSIST